MGASPKRRAGEWRAAGKRICRHIFGIERVWVAGAHFVCAPSRGVSGVPRSLSATFRLNHKQWKLLVRLLDVDSPHPLRSTLVFGLIIFSSGCAEMLCPPTHRSRHTNDFVADFTGPNETIGSVLRSAYAPTRRLHAHLKCHFCCFCSSAAAPRTLSLPFTGFVYDAKRLFGAAFIRRISCDCQYIVCVDER